MKELRLPLIRKYFDMTNPDEKKEDYRNINEYWIKRLFDIKKMPTWGINDFIREFQYHKNELGLIEKIGKKFDVNVMTLGYPRKDDKTRIKKYEHAGIEIRTGKPEWGAEPGRIYFVIKHGMEII